MSNILQHNRNIFDLKLNEDNYWDFHLLTNNSYGVNENKKCLSVHIDFNDNDCVWFDEISSKPNIIWEDSKISNNITLDSIGFTGVDNGLYTYEKDKITNKEFLDIFLNSHYHIDGEDRRFKLKKINGNNQIYNYDCNILLLDDDVQVAQLNGGFYQGFFKIEGEEYQVLPLSFKNGDWTFEFELNKKDFKNNGYSLNEKYPENKGMFFYIGTRAENKWYKFYNVIDGENNIKFLSQNYSDEYVDDFIEKNIISQNKYFSIENNENEKYFADDYVNKNEYNNVHSSCLNNYVSDEYIEQDVNLPKISDIKTEEGYNITQPNIIEIKTDNKFITFNRTKNGYTVKDDIDDIETILYDKKVNNMENYFILFNRTKNGYDVNNIEKLIEEKSKDYNILNDLYRNALGFQIKDNGSIGYKYLVKNCDNENSYKIESEFSVENIIHQDKWHNIRIQIKPIKNKIKICDKNSNDGKMKIYFYVDSKLVLVSRELPILNLKSLNDIGSKQEGVPYNISLGGGTQGLCDVIYTNYMNDPTDILPLEKEFGGSFIGFLKSFKFYTC